VNCLYTKSYSKDWKLLWYL